MKKIGHFIRMSEDRKKFVIKKAEEIGVSVSAYINILISEKEKEEK